MLVGAETYKNSDTYGNQGQLAAIRIEQIPLPLLGMKPSVLLTKTDQSKTWKVKTHIVSQELTEEAAKAYRASNWRLADFILKNMKQI